MSGSGTGRRGGPFLAKFTDNKWWDGDYTETAGGQCDFAFCGGDRKVCPMSEVIKPGDHNVGVGDDVVAYYPPDGYVGYAWKGRVTRMRTMVHVQYGIDKADIPIELAHKLTPLTQSRARDQ